MEEQENHKQKTQILSLEQEKFEQLFLTHHAMLFHYGFSFSNDEQLVEDCIQELFIYLYEKEINLNKIQNLKAYFFTALRRRILEKKQIKSKNNILDQRIEIQFSAEDLLIEKEEKGQKHQILTKELNNLPWRQKEAIYLKFFNNLSAKEIAEIMGITSQVVSNTVYKALKKLKEISTNSMLITVANTLQFLHF